MATWSVLASLRISNFAIDDILRYCKDKANAWPVREEVAAIYRLISKGAKLREFAAHSVSAGRETLFFVYLSHGIRFR